MTFIQVLYQLILGPIELLFDVVFSLAYQFTDNAGVSLIFLSMAINLLVLPLYRRADALQEEERQQSQKLKPGINHIKKMFKGDERFMILQTYYRQNNYKPYYALKGSLSLLLEIPFFIAAYRYLSDLRMLQGVSFGPIDNLGLPDELITWGGITLHLLPIVMTVVNIVSGFIYTKGMPLKSKIQLYGMAIVFLVLLYDSPSGLVLYWTLNNVFSLLKNIFYKIQNPRKAIKCVCSVIGVILVVWAFTFHHSTRHFVIIIGAGMLLQLPILVWKKTTINTNKNDITINSKIERVIFYTEMIFLTVLLGALIPSTVINTSPEEFVELLRYRPPIIYVERALLVSAGTFLWLVIFYKLASNQTKHLMSFASLIVSASALIDYMFFGTNYGNLSPLLQYDHPIKVNAFQIILNCAVLIGTALVLWFIWIKRINILKVTCLAGCITVVVMSGINIYELTNKTERIRAKNEKNLREEAEFRIDKSGKNVIVIMLDRAISGYVPYIMQEKPELQEQFDGFTYYPNTLSYGAYTNVCTTPLYGGYDYIPDEINLRSDVLLKDKQNEALKIMPYNFLDNGFKVTVCDPTYANYSWIPDLSIFDERPEIRTFNTMYQFVGDEDIIIEKEFRIWERDMFCYSVFRAVPVIIQPEIYNGGNYNEADAMNEKEVDSSAKQVVDNVSQSHGVSASFMKPYLALSNYINMTTITDEQIDTFMMISNDVTHSSILLQEPEYEPKNIVDNREYDAAHSIRYGLNGEELELTWDYTMQTYHSLMCAMIKLGEWFDFLKENDAWDNTRIIIVSDHGANVGLWERRLELPEYFSSDKDKAYLDTLYYNSLFMVKDFNATKFTVDDTFMTNADTPFKAFEGIIEEPKNPFLKRNITDAHKYDPEKHVVFRDWHIDENNNGYTFLEADESRWITRWLTFRNSNIMNLSNWTVERDYPNK